MDRMIHTSLSAMRGIMLHQTAIANNMANVGTAGFRAEIVNAKALYQHGPTLAARAIADEQVVAANLDPGPVTTTGRPLDIAMNGDAMLSVQAPNADTAYTRRGDLQVWDSGLVTTGDGHPVLGENGPLTLPPFDRIDITKDGSVWIAPAGAGDGPLQRVDRLALVSTSGSKITKGEDNLFRVPDDGVLPPDANATVTSGALEGSNVNMAQAMVDMIEAGRAWETQVKLLSTAQDMDRDTANLMQLPG